jgi:hypothetical protein
MLKCSLFTPLGKRISIYYSPHALQLLNLIAFLTPSAPWAKWRICSQKVGDKIEVHEVKNYLKLACSMA